MRERGDRFRCRRTIVLHSLPTWDIVRRLPADNRSGLENRRLKVAFYESTSVQRSDILSHFRPLAFSIGHLTSPLFCFDSARIRYYMIVPSSGTYCNSVSEAARPGGKAKQRSGKWSKQSSISAVSTVAEPNPSNKKASSRLWPAAHLRSYSVSVLLKPGYHPWVPQAKLRERTGCQR